MVEIPFQISKSKAIKLVSRVLSTQWLLSLLSISESHPPRYQTQETPTRYLPRLWHCGKREFPPCYYANISS